MTVSPQRRLRGRRAWEGGRGDAAASTLLALSD